MEALFNEFKSVQTIEECEEFILRHGENIVDLLGAEVDRIENELKVIYIRKNRITFNNISLCQF